MDVGSRKFRSDSWFRVLKRKLPNTNVDTVLCIEEAVLRTESREGAGTLGITGTLL